MTNNQQYQPRTDLERELYKDLVRRTSVRPITKEMIAQRMSEEDVMVEVRKVPYRHN